MAVYDRGSETLRRKEQRRRQVTDLPRIRLAKPFDQGFLLSAAFSAIEEPQVNNLRYAVNAVSCSVVFNSEIERNSESATENWTRGEVSGWLNRN